ncbi:MAG: MSMEG_0565 family glycosyltransferase [Acidimicrobiales bacterium]
MRRTAGPDVALVTYSTKPRGGVVHTLHLAEALWRAGRSVHVVALGDPGTGFFRPTPVPHTIVPSPPPAPALEDRVLEAVEALGAGLGHVADHFGILHAQDCVAARAATTVRDAGAAITVVRTVHHVDDFTTPALVDCQRRAIVEPDQVLVVSEHWRELLAREYGVEAGVVTNGIGLDRLRPPAQPSPAALREEVGATNRFVFLTVGGIEPRKGSLTLIDALGRVTSALDPAPAVVVLGGTSFQDYSSYRERALARADDLGLRRAGDLVVRGPVTEEELAAWYHAADAFVFPSEKEGFGLAVLEAMAVGLPAIASDIPVFREHLHDGEGVLLVPAGDPGALGAAMVRIATSPLLRERLGRIGPVVARRFTWERCARQHVALYERLGRQGLVRQEATGS